ncbi:MAG: hypothetical protein HC906_05175 [Bacteroidales bacterium]|nr:hypothetical protein [Bacteroidales bacterium]
MMKQNRYDDALLKYKGAQTLKPTETYPSEKIKEIEAILAQKQNEQQQKSATESQFNTLLSKGNNEMANKQYTAAKQSYQQALELKPNDSFCKNKNGRTG